MPDMMPGGREESKILSDGPQSITQSNKETLIYIDLFIKYYKMGVKIF
jgi:hypothetical protein